MQTRNDAWALGCITLQLLSQKSLRLSPYHPYNMVAESVTETDSLVGRVKKLMSNEAKLASYESHARGRKGDGGIP